MQIFPPLPESIEAQLHSVYEAEYGLTLPSWNVLHTMFQQTILKLFTYPRAGFLGKLASDHEYVWDLTCPTAWCSGEKIGFNPYFYLSLPVETRVTILAHELYHTGYAHMLRVGGRCPDKWNEAADYVINLGLKIDGFSFAGTHPLLDSKYKDMSTKEVYDLIAPQAGGGGQTPEELKTPGQQAQEVIEGMQGNTSGQPQQQQGGQGNMQGDLRKPEPKSAEEGGNSVETDIVQKIVAAQQSAILAGDPGSIPGETSELISEFLKPVLPWNVLLDRFMTELSNDVYSWARPNRRYDDVYLPSLTGKNGLEHIVYFLDTSGSMSKEELLRTNSEVASIHRDLQPERLTIITFDTKIQDVYDFYKDDPFKSIVVHGRGGTSLTPVFDWIKENKPTAAIIFSDMYVKPHTEDPRIPVLWIAVDNKRAKVNFGKLIHMTRKQVKGEK